MPLIKVADTTVTLEEFKESLLLEIKSHSNFDASQIDKIKKQHAKDLIFQILIERWAKKNQIEAPKITISKTEKEIFHIKKIPLESVRKQKNQKEIHRLLMNHLSKKIKNPPLSEQKKFYIKNKKKFIIKKSCYLEHILVTSQKLALTLRSQIVRGDSSFRKMKTIYSLKPDIGWIESGNIKTFDKACLLPTKALSPVLKSPYGYHLFKVIKKRPKKRLSFSKVQKKIVNQMKEKEKKKAFQTWLSTEFSKTFVLIDENLLDKIPIQYKKTTL